MSKKIQNTNPQGTNNVTGEEMDLVASIVAAQQQEMVPEEEPVVDFLFRTKPYTYEQFAADFNISENVLVTTVEILKQQGHITDMNPDTREKFIRKVEKEATTIEAGKAIIMDQIQETNFKLATKRQGVPTYESVEFEFGTQAKLNDFRTAVINLNLESEILIDENGFYLLRVFNITDKDLGKLSMLYKANKVIASGVSRAEQTTDNAVKVVDYTVKNIASPVARAGFGAGVKIAKTLTTGLFRLGAMATSEIIEGTRATAHEIKNDPNVAVAKAELIQAKNDILDRSGRNMAGTSGIRINR